MPYSHHMIWWYGKTFGYKSDRHKAAIWMYWHT